MFNGNGPLVVEGKCPPSFLPIGSCLYLYSSYYTRNTFPTDCLSTLYNKKHLCLYFIMDMICIVSYTRELPSIGTIPSCLWYYLVLMMVTPIYVVFIIKSFYLAR